MAPLHARASGKAVRRLPPELLSDIAAFVDQRRSDEDDVEWRTQSVFQDLRNAAATCRAWRGPFSRQLMQELHVTIGRWTEHKTRDLSLARRYPIHRLRVSLVRDKTAAAKFFFDLLSLTRSSVKALCVSQEELVLDLFAIKYDLQNLERLELSGIESCRFEWLRHMRPVLPKLTFLKCREGRFHALSHFARHVSTPALVKIELKCGYNQLFDHASPTREALEVELLTCKGVRLKEVSLILEDDGLDASSTIIKLLVEGLQACKSLRIFRLSVLSYAGCRGRNHSQELNSVRPLVAAIPSYAPFHTLCINFSIYAKLGFEVCLVALLKSLQTSELPRLVDIQVWFHMFDTRVGQKEAVVWSKTKIDSQLNETTWDELKSWCDKENVTIDLNVIGRLTKSNG
ncbi:BZ3500_MvSof-1268-A1-R1_Chr10-2g03012 [Microbotryum saponariae]|uniref:BZ3500_MvSof-1268-A1-R1_Chr10-2g03012 protein n=1 Tax=Microbotryum saponariae TaxID=289078 RepID=A0A2X0MBS4_9BASI|nr:BZ3501_MvSof-1269-A2-R1_Chr10-2g02598 [Microbotryum saponariae]SDA01925.1 BZ3500_MvSof-1268-A1-R1_Chr10-2g03012 [Microbotryum saponariae]